MKQKSAALIRHTKETLTDFSARVRDEFRHARRTIANEVEMLISERPRLKIKNIHQIADMALERMAAYAAQLARSLAELREQKVLAQANYRRFQVENGITRDARQPDVTMTLLILQCGFLAEGLLGGALFIADGHFDLLTSFATGFAIAGINALAACAAGYFGGRYIGYRIDAITPLLRDQAIRMLAWLGLIVMLCGLAVLHFGAARVRVTGKHSGLFDFSTVSFADTFNDYFALGLITVGVVGAAIAFFKGRNGLSDPIVGYSQVARDTELHCKQAAENLYHDAIAHIETMQAAACETVEGRFDETQKRGQHYRQERYALAERISRHNDQLDHMVEVLHGMQSKEQDTDAFIRQSAPPATSLDVTGFDALRLPVLVDEQALLDIADETHPDDLLDAIEQASQEALAQIEKAYNAFLMPVTAYSPIFPNPQIEEV